MSDMLIPSPQELAAELAGLLRTGVTSGALTSCPGLLGLAVVAAKSASDKAGDRAVAASSLISEAAVRVDGVKDGAAATLLGVAQGSRGALLKERRRRAAGLLKVQPDHFRKEREDPLLEALADELYALDSAYRLRHRHRMEGVRAPEDSALRVDWLAQHRSYRRIWTPVYAMRADLLVLLGYLRDGHDDHADVADRLCNVTWRYAQFLREIERFIENEGGLWLLADATSEVAAADAVYRTEVLTPFGEADNSWLRLLLKQSAGEELEPFTDQLIAAGERRRELMGAWMAWAEACNQKPDEDDPGCEVHQWLAATQDFITLIDEDWLRVADWYRGEARLDPRPDVLP